MAFDKTEKKLSRWQEQGLISTEQAKRIAEFELARKKDGSFSRLIIMLGGFSLILGLMAIIGANWNSIPVAVKLGAHALLSLGLAYGFYTKRDTKGWTKDIFLLLIFGTNLSFIALIGQIFQVQAHPFFAIFIWMVISSPLILAYASTQFMAYAWIVGVIAKNILLSFWLSQEIGTTSPVATLAASSVSLIYFILSHTKAIDARFSIFTYPLRKLSTLGIIFGASMVQLTWRMNFDTEAMRLYWDNISSIILNIVAYAFVVFICAQKKGVWPLRPAAWFFALSTIAILFPVSFTHPPIPFIGAVCFIAYWVGLGYAAYLMGLKKELDWVIWVISIRLFIVYTEVFGTLASTGFGLILGGVIFIGLGWGARKMQKALGEKHA